MCLTLKDSAPGKSVVIEGCREHDNNQVGEPVAAKFLTNSIPGKCTANFHPKYNECHIFINKPNINKTIRD